MIETERLLLRRWTEGDRERFARLNSDARVMEFLPQRLPAPESDRLVERIQEHFRKHGFGPVSYTHLDVYKRQVVSSPRKIVMRELR